MKTEPKYSESLAKPTRGPKNPEKMKAGKLARDKGERHQDGVAKYLGMLNRWPFPGVDIKGAIFSVEAKTLNYQYPEFVETMLQEAEFRARKARPESVAVLNIHRDNFGKTLDHDLIVMRMKDFRWLLERMGEE